MKARKLALNLALAALIAAGTASCGAGGAAMPPPPPQPTGVPTSQATSPPTRLKWVAFQGDIVSASGSEVELRDRSGATVFMEASAVRTGPAGVELQIGGKILGRMVQSQDPATPGSRRVSMGPRPVASAPSAVPYAAPSSAPHDAPNGGRMMGSPSSGAAPDLGCFGVYEYRCDDGTFTGFCMGGHSCNQ